ncbi:MAG: type I restriction endonuclease subunit R [Rhodospirillales bacterium]|nr:type I restriction endonuclease subunit R [Rhodospirillales bacterium]
MAVFTESELEKAALAWLEAVGWNVAHGPDIGPDAAGFERTDFGTVTLERRLRDALARLNPNLSSAALDVAFRELHRIDGTTVVTRNRDFHRKVVNGIDVEYRAEGGATRSAHVRIVDFDDPSDNDWLAVNQFTVVENRHERRPDIVLFVNGLPLGLIELKNPADEDATIWTAWRQLQTYREELPSLFAMNAALIVSDGIEARIGTLTAEREWFMPWRTTSGETLADLDLPQLQVMLAGGCDRGRFLALVRDFIVFEDDGRGAPAKKMAGYHQFHAVRTAVAETLRAAKLQQDAVPGDGAGRGAPGRQPGGAPGDRRIGVVWHTQGSGKSLTMAFYAGRIAREPAMENPTIVVLTDRNDLDDQLFGTFARCQDLLGQPPEQAASRADLRRMLAVEQGGVVFTTIQKFFPEEKGDRHPQLSERRNVVVIADEAHRSQYDFVDGFARHMRDALPNASFVGFTGTPIELQDANTRAVFGDYISIYDIQRAVEDGATVPIYYESRLAKLALDESERPNIDSGFEEVTEGEEHGRKEKLKSKWAQLEAVVGAEKRIALVAEDIVQHFARRTEVMDGKALIVCMSRRICIELYRALIRLRPDWEHGDDDKGKVKVVMTGVASDPPNWQPHIRNKARRETLAKRFRAAGDPLRIVLVRDMWLTGFDTPSLHTMYVDRPMRGHGLMQAIARVNRVFKDKPGGLVVDYFGLAHDLRRALVTYTESGGTGRTALDQSEAVALMLEKHEVCLGLFHGFDFSRWIDGTPAERVGLLPAAQEHILAQENGKDRCLQAVRELSQAFALAVPHEEAMCIRDDVAFFQAVRSVLAKRAAGESRSGEDLDQAIRQIVSRAVASESVLDIFAAAGLDKPDISILSEEFLAEVRGMPQRNLAVELLRKLLKGELAARRRKNVVQARSFAEMLEETLRRYRNRAIEAAQVIEELIQLARELREANARGEQLGLSEDELAFYDALGTNDSAVQVLGDETLRIIARELVDTVRSNVTIDWTLRENVRANLRRLIKRILRRHGYPPDKQEKATRTVLEQAEALSANWVV